jgi:hypothetical protein
MILRSHILTMALYALFASLVLALIRRGEAKDRIRYGVSLFLIMVLGAIAFGWFMFLIAK